MTGVEVALIATAAMLIGYFSGRRREKVATDIHEAVEWHDHVHSAMWVARRTPGPDYEETQETRP
jgi:hypothetical protein